MEKLVLFWALVGLAGFALLLAVQMRVLTAAVLRRALQACDEGLSGAEANAAVMQAAGEDVGGETGKLSAAAQILRAQYPRPLAHLRRARRASLVAPVALIALLALGRLVLGVI